MPLLIDAPACCTSRRRGVLALCAVAALLGCSSPMPQPPAPTSVSTPVPVAEAIAAAAPAVSAPAQSAASMPAASSAPTPTPQAEAAVRFEAAASRLLAYAERVRELGPADLAREQVRLADAGDEPVNRLQLVLLLAYSRQNGDLPRAMSVLEPLTRPGTQAPWRGLARLLQDRLQEQRRLEEQTERQTQQLRDQQRRIDQLSNQLEALKAIERSISGRPPGAAAPLAPGANRMAP